MAISSSALNIVGVFQRYTQLSPASHSGKQWQGACCTLRPIGRLLYI